MPRFDPHPERRAAVVTGASSGIGQATALALAEAGHPVVLGARRVERLEETAAQIREAGGEALALSLDLLDHDSIAAFAERAERELGPIEVLVSNAGEVRPISTTEADPQEFARQLGVNLLGAQALVRELVPDMVERGRGDVVVVTSEVARVPRPFMAGYVASKAGLEALARAMQMELEGSGVRVTILRPGPASTEQGSDWSVEEIELVTESWQRWGVMRHPGYLRPSDVANAVLAVVSIPKGTHITEIEVQPEAPVERADRGGNP